MGRERLVIVAPGPETLRLVGRQSSTHPAAVAVDRVGRPRFFGQEAVESASAWPDGFTLETPFDSVDMSSVELTVSYMWWLFRTAPHAARHPSAAFVVPSAGQERWRSICDRMPGQTAVLLRPITVASGMGLDVDASTPHLVIDVRADGAEVAMVGESQVLGTRETAVTTPEALARTATALLQDFDLDIEYDVRAEGAYAIGIEPEDADRLARLLGVIVRVGIRPERVLASGVMADRRLIEAVFGKGRVPAGRLGHRTHRPLRAG
ncbi:MAG: hypothetical protein DIU67_004645 [Actinomycetes bacterium]|nr:MAG: hypothetical protein DIU67_05930 [Actinomycetota bacterium]